MQIKRVISVLEELAPLSYQEEYDNAGLAIGNQDQEVDGCLVCLDINEAVIAEATSKGLKLVISHHPLIFKGLKRVTGQSMTERIVNQAIKEDISVYSMHTNLDNVYAGVNRILCDKLGLKDVSILRKMGDTLRKLVTYCPGSHAVRVREAVFAAGAGHIGEYDQCSFNSEGTGTFRAGKEANPFVGAVGSIHYEPEIRIETIFPAFLQQNVIRALLESHPYEEVAYDIYRLENESNRHGAGMIGYLPEVMTENDFLILLKETLHIQCIRHSPLLGKKVEKIAVCGGAGSFLIPDAIKQKADFFVSGDIKYHQFFDADGKIVIADAGHFETEQFTCNLLADHLKKNFSNFAVQISETTVNPVNYF